MTATTLTEFSVNNLSLNWLQYGFLARVGKVLWLTRSGFVIMKVTILDNWVEY